MMRQILITSFITFLIFQNSFSQINTEFLLDTLPVNLGDLYHDHGCCSHNSDVVFANNKYLVVWSSTEVDPDPNIIHDSDIFGAFFDRNQNILHPGIFSVSESPGSEINPSVKFDGTNYLVVWVDDINLYGIRLDSLGTTLDLNPFLISTKAISDYGAANTALAFDGTNYMVTWTDLGNYHSTAGKVLASRITPLGQVLDPQGILVYTSPGWLTRNPHIAFNGTHYLITYKLCKSPQREVRCSRVTTSGTVLGHIFLSGDIFNKYPHVTTDGNNFMVYWSYRNLHIKIIDNAGNVQDASIGGGGTETTACFDGENYVIIVDAVSSIGIFVIDRAGVLIDSTFQPYSMYSYHQYIGPLVYTGDQFLLTTHQIWYGINNMIYCTLDTNFTVTTPPQPLLKINTNPQQNPSVAYNGTNYLVSWEDQCRIGLDNDAGGMPDDIRGTFVDNFGNIVEPNGYTLASGEEQGRYGYLRYHNPNCISIENDFLIAMEQNWLSKGGWGWPSGGSEIILNRLTTNGIILDTINITNNSFWQFFSNTSVCFNGSQYFYVWENSNIYNQSDQGIYGRRLDATGNLLDSTCIRISVKDSVQSSPSIAYGGPNYLAVWQDHRNGLFEIYGTLIDQQGNILDTNGFVISSGSDSKECPEVCFDDSNYLVVWQEYSGNSWDIHGIRVDQLGRPIDSDNIIICNEPQNQKHPTLIFDGTNYIVVWEDYRNGMDSDIYYTTITVTGTVAQSTPVSNQSRDQLSPALARGSGNQVFIVYSGWTDSVDGKLYNQLRIWGKFIGTASGITLENRSIVDQYNLFQNYPNPFNPSTTIKFDLPKTTQVIMKVFNILGEEVTTLVSDRLSAGSYSYDWDASNLASGVYLYRLQAGDYVETRKMILMR
ncbi:MAG: T9SS type A sorting domain-containing protein [Calditrichaeota bacterium]|nr:T9SS type A sorting domain-containing protein [Calditrichota bacterium]